MRSTSHVPSPYRLLRSLVTAAAFAAWPCAAHADGDAPAADSAGQPVSGLHVQLGGNFQPPRPGHDVSVTSNADGTRVLAVDTSGYAGGDLVGGPRQQVCVAPCTASLSPSVTYMVRGWGISDSAHFGVRDETRALNIHAGSAAVGVLGGVSLGLGITGVVAGAIMTPISYALGKRDSGRPVLMDVGWATLLGGAAMIGLGIVLDLASNTHIYDESGARLAATGGPRFTQGGLVF